MEQPIIRIFLQLFWFQRNFQGVFNLLIIRAFSSNFNTQSRLSVSWFLIRRYLIEKRIIYHIYMELEQLDLMLNLPN